LGESTRVHLIGMLKVVLIVHDRPLALPGGGGNSFIDFYSFFSFLFFTSSTSQPPKAFLQGYIEFCFPGVESNPFFTRFYFLIPSLLFPLFSLQYFLFSVNHEQVTVIRWAGYTRGFFSFLPFISLFLRSYLLIMFFLRLQKRYEVTQRSPFFFFPVATFSQPNPFCCNL